MISKTRDEEWSIEDARRGTEGQIPVRHDFAAERVPGREGRSPQPSTRSSSPRPRAQGYRKGFDAAEREGHSGRRRAAPRPPSSRSAARSSASQRHRRGRARLEAEAVEVAVAVARKLAPALMRASRSPRSRRSPPSAFATRRRAARRGARQRRALRNRQRAARRDRPHAAASRAASWCSPSPRSRSATAASNGPMAASSATGPQTEPTIGDGHRPLSRRAAHRRTCLNWRDRHE